MKVFIWPYVDNVSGSYHSGGSLVVFAGSEKEARELAESFDSNCIVREDEKPTYVREVSGEEVRVFIFADAGCC